MSIKFQCPGCGKRLRVADGQAGQQLVCPQCSQPIEVPTATSAKSRNAPAEAPPAEAVAANPFTSAKEVIAPGSASGFATEDELPPDPEISAKVFAPAMALMAVGVCGLLLRLAGSLRYVFDLHLPGRAEAAEKFLWPGAANATTFLILMAAVLIASGFRMARLQSYWFAVGSSVLAMVPCLSPCCSLGLPVGLWSLTVLWNNDVKAAFRE